MAVELVGVDKLRRTMAQAVDELDDLAELHQALGDLVVAAAAPLTPIRTGRLLAGTTAVGTAHETLVTNAVPYAAPVHARRPFMADAAADVEDAQLAEADRYIQTILDTIQGA